MMKNSEIAKTFSHQIEIFNSEAENSSFLTNIIKQYLDQYTNALKDFNQRMLDVTTFYAKKINDDEKRYLESQVKNTLKTFQLHFQDSLNLNECNSLCTSQLKEVYKTIIESKRKVVGVLFKRQKDIETNIKYVCSLLKKFENIDAKNSTLQTKIEKEKIMCESLPKEKRVKQLKKLNERSKTSQDVLNKQKLTYASHHSALVQQVDFYGRDLYSLIRDFIMQDDVVVQKMTTYTETLMKMHECSTQRLKCLTEQLSNVADFPRMMIESHPPLSKNLEIDLPRMKTLELSADKSSEEVVKYWMDKRQEAEDQLKHLYSTGETSIEKTEMIANSKQTIDICGSIIAQMNCDNPYDFDPTYQSIENSDPTYSNSDNSSDHSITYKVVPPSDEASILSSNVRQGVVLHSYEGDVDGYLSVSPGETVTFMGEYDPDAWCYVINMDGQTGYVPGNYIEIQK